MNPQILVVDDDAMVLETATQALAAFGYPAVPCSSPEKALAALQTNMFSAVLADIKMPGA
jgi:CheY-like chemotaxis protein